MVLPIVHYNHPVLHKKGARITTFAAALSMLAHDMIETMHEAHGIGLAAQQVGRALQLCVADLRDVEARFTWRLDGAKPPIELFMPLILVNPVIEIERGTPGKIDEEGCLSFPEIRGDVERPDGIVAKFQDENGVPHVLACNGLLSRCIQHELDHLNGVLFIDRMDKPTRTKVDEAVKALAKETRLAAKKPSS
jgi:peptide deformylase